MGLYQSRFIYPDLYLYPSIHLDIDLKDSGIVSTWGLTVEASAMTMKPWNGILDRVHV